MRKLTKSDLQTLAETMPVIPVDEQRGYLAMGSYAPEPPVTYLSEEDIANFLSGLDRTTAYSGDCVFAVAALGNIGGTNDQAEINKLAEEFVLAYRQPQLQMYIEQGMNSEEATQKYLRENGAKLTPDEAQNVYNKELVQSGATLFLRHYKDGNGKVTRHWMLVTGYDSETETYYLFDGSESSYLNSGDRTLGISLYDLKYEGVDYEIWNGTTRVGTKNGVMGSWDWENGAFTPFGNDSGSGSSSDDGNGSNDYGSSGSSGDNPWHPPGYSSGYYYY